MFHWLYKNHIKVGLNLSINESNGLAKTNDYINSWIEFNVITNYYVFWIVFVVDFGFDRSDKTLVFVQLSQKRRSLHSTTVHRGFGWPDGWSQSAIAAQNRYWLWDRVKQQISAVCLKQMVLFEMIYTNN